MFSTAVNVREEAEWSWCVRGLGSPVLTVGVIRLEMSLAQVSSLQPRSKTCEYGRLSFSSSASAFAFDIYRLESQNVKDGTIGILSANSIKFV